MADTEGPPDQDAEDPTVEAKRRRLKAAGGAAVHMAFTHRDKLMAALELLREKNAVSDAEEAEIVAAYERGDEATRTTIDHLV